MPPIVRGAFEHTVIQLYFSFRVAPEFQGAYHMLYSLSLSLWSFSMFFKVDSFIVGASKAQEDAL